MSTTFGIHKDGKDIELIDDCLPEGYEEDDFIWVARRICYVRWIDDLAPFLPPDLKVYPLDNSAQGIYTIGDILKEIEE